MYKDNSQFRIEDFVFPYGKLDTENDWVKLAELVPWNVAEERYAAQFVNNGHPAHPARVALGSLLIQRRLKCSDQWLVKHINENPYLQFFIRPLAKIKERVKIEDMKYEKIAEYSNEKFRRITGVKRATFEKMVEILGKGYAEKHRHRGRTPKLSIEDMLLATLEYLREYRTYARIAASYGIAESNIYRGIKWVEDTLIRDGTFSLPGRKAPLKSDMEYEVILVDATESPIERPKKAKATQAKATKVG